MGEIQEGMEWLCATSPKRKGGNIIDAPSLF